MQCVDAWARRNAVYQGWLFYCWNIHQHHLAQTLMLNKRLEWPYNTLSTGLKDCSSPDGCMLSSVIICQATGKLEVSSELFSTLQQLSEEKLQIICSALICDVPGNRYHVWLCIHHSHREERKLQNKGTPWNNIAWAGGNSSLLVSARITIACLKVWCMTRNHIDLQCVFLIISSQKASPVVVIKAIVIWYLSKQKREVCSFRTRWCAKVLGLWARF